MAGNSTVLSKLQILKNTIGPGLLLAGAAIGVSHLVQATRAGADYGFSLWWLLLLAIITKYPFLEFGPRFAAATGQHLIHGYRNLGKSYLNTFLIITVGTMFIIQAAVTIVTAGLAEYYFSLGWSPAFWSAIILSGCIVLLFLGRYPGLDFTMKVIISILTLSTLIAVVLALSAGTVSEVVQAESPSYWNAAGVAFIIAFMGWMPIPLDSAVWHSIWSLEKARNSKYRPTLKEAKLDFHLGYFTAALIGLLFFVLGALIMFGSGTRFSANSVIFSAELVNLYGLTLGTWSTPFIGVAAFIAMFSTTLAVTDAFPRVMSELHNTYKEDTLTDTDKWKTYIISLITIPFVAVIILFFLSGTFTVLIDFAAGLSFLAAPVLAWFNLKLVTGQQMPEQHKPSKFYVIFSWACIFFLILFSLIYLYWRFIGL